MVVPPLVGAVTREMPAEAEALLTSEPLVAHLATCADGDPHVAPVWYDYRDGAVEVVTTGRKLANVRANHRVALSVQKEEGGRPQWGVVVRGTATVVADEAETRAAVSRINRRYGADEDAWAENALVRIDVGSVAHWAY